MPEAQHLDAAAQAVFDAITHNAKAAYNRWGQPGGAFMPLTAERLGQTDLGPIYSLYHYYKQNGDVCMDPDVTFVVLDDGFAYPLTFEVSGFVHVEAMAVTERGLAIKGDQDDLVQFCNQWLRNVQDQHELNPAGTEGGAR